jgi:hypothetical protein
MFVFDVLVYLIPVTSGSIWFKTSPTSWNYFFTKVANFFTELQISEKMFNPVLNDVEEMQRIMVATINKLKIGTEESKTNRER